MSGYWSAQKDISDTDWLIAEGESVGLDSRELKLSTTSDAFKKRLTTNMETAVNRNLFGLPACVIDGKIFWGNDRLDLLKRYLDN